MPLTPEKIQTIILALRKCATTLEEELGLQSPVLPKRSRKKEMKEHFEKFYEMGIRRKPRELNTKNKVV